MGVYNKRFNSIFFGLLQFSGVAGTLMAFAVLEFVPGVSTPCTVCSWCWVVAQSVVFW